jgi:hypothetical protein
MKLFDKFEAVKFPEENLIFVTHDGYLYYIYNPKYETWRKHHNAGNDYITVSNYQDISREELLKAMNGVLPKRETDFMRLCSPSQLCIRDMLGLLKEDYVNYMSDYTLYHTVHEFLLESNKSVRHKSYEAIQKLFETSSSLQQPNQYVLNELKQLSSTFLGRDIFKKEIGIVDGHDSSSYFWIMPVRVIDYSNTESLDNIAEMRSAEISIEEDDVAQYLTPFLYKYFDEELEANKKRVESYWIDDDGNEQATPVEGFEWYLTYNFFTFDSVKKILEDIADTIDALSSGRKTEYTDKLKVKRGSATHQLLYAKDLTQEQIDTYNANRPKEDNTEVDLLIDFYQRFSYRMEYMMRVGKEKGYDLISFMGP